MRCLLFLLYYTIELGDTSEWRVYWLIYNFFMEVECTADERRVYDVIKCCAKKGRWLFLILVYNRGTGVEVSGGCIG